MAGSHRKDPGITQSNSKKYIGSKRGMSRRAKRNSNKIDRRLLNEDTKYMMDIFETEIQKQEQEIARNEQLLLRLILRRNNLVRLSKRAEQAWSDACGYLGQQSLMPQDPRDLTAPKRVWFYVDRDDTNIENYNCLQLASLFARYPDAIEYKWGMPYTELRDGSPDIYVFDISGLGCIDPSGQGRMKWCEEVLLQVPNHPKTLFIPCSGITRGYFWVALEDTLPEAVDSPNIFCPQIDNGREYEAELHAKLKEWFAAS